MSINIETLFKNTEKLPTINSVAFRVIQLCSDSEVPIPKLVKVIASDLSLSSQILRVANSSFFNYPRKIYSLDRAIVILGFNLLRDISVSLSIFSLYNGFESSLQKDVKSLWKHSLITGLIMKTIAEHYRPEDKDVLYIGGLLHDIGKLFLLHSLKEDYYFLLEKSDKDDKKMHQLEEKFFGLNHAQVGEKLLEFWKLPPTLCSIVRYHHEPEKCSDDEEAMSRSKMVFLGNLIFYLIEKDIETTAQIKEIDPDFEKYFSFSDAELADLLENIKNELQDQQKYIELFE